MTEEDTVKYSVTPHRLNDTLIKNIVQNAQQYNKQHQQNIENLQENNKEQATPQKTADELKKDIRQIYQIGYKNGTISNRDELVAVLKQQGYEVKENEKSIRISLAGSDQAVNLKGEAFTKGYDVIKSLKERLEPEILKQAYPTLKDSDLVHITAYKNKLFDEHKEQTNPKTLQMALLKLEEGVKALSKGKEMNLPDLPVLEIKPDIDVNLPTQNNKNRTR